MCVLIQQGSTVQLVIAFVYTLVMLLFTSITEPYALKTCDYFSLLCNFSLVAVFFFCLVLKMGGFAEEVDNLGVLSTELKDLYTYDAAQLSVVLTAVLLSSVVGAVGLAAYHMFHSAREATRLARAERETAEARGRMSSPPTCDWQLKEGNKYLTFLSHFKVEAGSDARCMLPTLLPTITHPSLRVLPESTRGAAAQISRTCSSA